MIIKVGDLAFEYKPEYGLGLIDNVLEMDPECKELELDKIHLETVKQIIEGNFIKYDGKNKNIIEYTHHSLSYLLYDIGKLKQWYISSIIKPISDLIIDKKSVETFFEKHLDNVDWQLLSCNINLSESFFERHLDKVDWEILSQNKNMNEAFFE